MIEVITRSTCERCGKIYERYGGLVQLVGGWTKLEITTKWNDRKTDDECSTETKILCKQCGDELRQWLKKEAQ
jgi:hypothetical protein